MQPHQFDLTSFIWGLLFSGLAITYAVTDARLTSVEGRWVWPAVLILAAGAILWSVRARTSEAPASVGGQAIDLDLDLARSIDDTDYPDVPPPVFLDPGGESSPVVSTEELLDDAEWEPPGGIDEPS